MIRKEIIGGCELYLGDCREILPTLDPVNAVMTDPPYGITSNAWDVAANMDPIWAVDASVYVITASQPFTADVVNSKRGWFRHEWVWIKDRGSNFANTVREPMKEHESVLVFSPGRWTYNKQMQNRVGGGLERVAYTFQNKAGSDNYREFDREGRREGDNMRVPASWQFFKRDTGLHPTQKPVDLMSYLILTYTNEGDIVLDPFFGSGTTAVACAKLGRRFVGIEMNPEYYDIALMRLDGIAKQPDLFVESAPAQPQQLSLMEPAE
jgi:site-specific DNA-methyltransferase (adenine-specific)